ncbi:hypothetical protein [Streptomyces sp. NPDC002644]
MDEDDGPVIEVVTRERGYFLAAEGSRKNGSTMEMVPDLPSIAVWVVDNFGYYLANDTMQRIKKVTEAGGVLMVEFAYEEAGEEQEAITLYVARGK